ncbi:MAG: PQQ-dependent sugar dehydrogenase [Planctomycetota bacterium]
MPRYAIALVLLGAGLRAQSLPLGFVVETMAPNQHGPISLDFLPDGRALFAEQDTGAVKVIANAAVATIGTVPGLRVSYSQGLIAIAVDPQWPQRPFVYCYHTDAVAQDLRITRFAATGDLTNAASTNLQLTSAYVVLDGIPDTMPQHEGGCLRFAGDGTLYASFGDDLAHCLSQDVTAWNGKIARLRVDALPAGAGGPPPRAALVPAGNPFTGPGDVAPLVWALGLRNPFRFHIDPADDSLFVADVGEAAFDEIDRIDGSGRNLGWPWREGHAAFMVCGVSEPPSTPPIVEHAVPAVYFALISLGVYRAPATAPHRFGAGYEGDYFCTDHFTGRIWRVHRNGAAWGTAAPVLASRPPNSGPPGCRGSRTHASPPTGRCGSSNGSSAASAACAASGPRPPRSRPSVRGACRADPCSRRRRRSCLFSASRSTCRSRSCRRPDSRSACSGSRSRAGARWRCRCRSPATACRAARDSSRPM